MDLIPAWALNGRELRSLGASVLREVMADAREVHRHRGTRRPDGYTCGIPCLLQTPLLQVALRNVLDRISDQSFDDALRLEERVWGVVPILRQSSPLGPRESRWIECLGGWDFSPQFEDESLLGCVISGGRYGFDVVCIRDEETDFRVACYLFAHEFGHVLYPGEWLPHEGHGRYVQVECLRESGADRCAINWGFGAELERATEYFRSLQTPRATEKTGVPAAGSDCRRG